MKVGARHALPNCAELFRLGKACLAPIAQLVVF